MGRFQVGTLEQVLGTDWTEVFTKAKEIGFDGVELGVQGDSYRDSELWTEGGIEALAARQKASLPIFAVCLHTFWKFTFADPDVANRTTAKQILLHTIQACSQLGVDAILVPVTNPNKLPAEESFKRWTEETKACAAEAEKHNVRIALENVGRSHIVTGEQLLEQIEAVGSTHVGAYFDIGNAQMLGSHSVNDIKTLGSKIFKVHIKDPKKDRTPCYVGEGDIDIDGCLKALAEVGYSGSLVFETPGLDDPIETARKNLNTMRSLIDKAGLA